MFPTKFIFILCSILCTLNVYALSPEILSEFTSDFMFIQNIEDDGYFITPVTRLDPRLTGSNKWSSLKGTRQVVLGYANDGADTAGYGTNYYLDMWETNSPIQYPYVNQSCILGYARCNSDAEAETKPMLVNSQGFFQLYPQAYGWMHAKLSNNFFEYLSNMPVGAKLTRTMNWCQTINAYNALAGGRCADQPTGRWRQRTLHSAKVAHVTFKRTNAIAEVMVDSSGLPLVLPGSSGCETAIVDSRNGIICEFLSYDFRNSGGDYARIGIHTVLTDGISIPSIRDVQISVDKVNWRWNGYKLSFETLKGHNKVYLFLSQNFLKAMFALNLDDIKTRDMVGFMFTNTLTPNSGYYELSGTTEIIVKPREFSVAIIPEDGFSQPHKEGKVGQDILSFGYNIITSAPTDAVRLDVSLSQDTVYGGPSPLYPGYCNFYPDGVNVVGKSIPVPAILSFATELGVDYNEPLDCWGRVVSLLDNNIKQSQAVVVDTLPSGDYVYTRFYNIKIDFDLTSPSVERTWDDSYWEGYAHQSGEIKVRALWN